jgi:hypothetical protein
MKPISEQVQYCRRIKLKTNQLIIKRTEKKISKWASPPNSHVNEITQ